MEPVQEEDELEPAQVETFRDQGFLKLEGVFEGDELETLQEVTERVVGRWGGSTGEGFFEGAFDDENQIQREELVGTDLNFLYHLEGYSTTFRDLIFDSRIVTPLTQLIGPDLELHVSSLHAKPPERGSPFPMHQDSQFFTHDGDAYVDCFVHTHDAPAETGPLQFIEGSHTDGIVPHQIAGDEFPYLSPDEYAFADATEVPCEAGDVVFMHYHTIHGSKLNHSGRIRPIIRLAYRDPQVMPTDSMCGDKPPLLVAGERTTDTPVPGNLH